MHKRLFTAAIGIVAVAMTITLSSCSSGGSASPTASAGNSKVSAEAQASAKALLTRPTKIALTTKLPSKAPTGKNIYFVQCAVPECALIGDYLSEGAASLGWTLHKVVVTSQSPEALAAAWNQVASANPDGVVSNGAPVSAISDALAKLKAEKVPVVEFSSPDPAGTGLTASLLSTAYSTQRGKVVADFFATDSKGKANAVYFNVPAYPILAFEVAGFKKELASACAACSVDVQEVDATTIGTTLPSQIVAYVRAHPKLNYIYVGFDSMYIGVPQALKAAGLNTQVRLVGDDPGAVNISYIKNGDEYAALAFPTGEGVYRSLDVIARTFLGSSITPSTDASFPLYMMTKKDLSKPLPKDRFDVVQDFAAQYKALWLVK